MSVVLETDVMQQIESLRLQVDAAHGQAQAIHRGSVREAVAHGSSRQERALNGMELTPEPGKPVSRTAAQPVAVAASAVEAEAPAGRQGAPRHGMGATPRRGARSGRTPRQGQGSGKARLSRKPIDLSMNFAAGGLL
ncbi:MAG: hypothetical protein Q8P67_06110 [archaeon]|nr:hypothetical protein [archaeon]